MQYIGLLMVLLSWAICGYLLTKWHNKELRSISTHASSAKPAFWLFASLMIIGGGIFYAWLAFWLAPRLGLGEGFQMLVALTYLAQTATAIVPDVPGRKHDIHNVTAYTMAFLFLPLAGLVVLAPDVSTFARIFGIIITAYMIGSFFWGVVLKRSQDKFLILQVIYILTLQIAVLAAAYL